MRALSTGLLLLLAPAGESWGDAGDARFLSQEALVAVASAGAVVAEATAPVWDTIPGNEVKLNPQHTVALLDRQANAALSSSGPLILTVRAAYDARDLAVALEWADGSESRASPTDPGMFGDTAALEIPERFGAGLRLPYIGMGDAAAHVRLSMARALDAGTDTRALVAAGFGSSTRTGAPVFRASMRYDSKRARWRAVFVLPLVGEAQDLRRGLVPIAFAAWDGAKNERGGNKALSRWKFLRLARWELEKDYLDELSFGYGSGDLGDPARGKQLVEGICVACHRIGEKQLAPVGMAPELTGVGRIAAPSYLRSSLLDPSEVLVPSPNPNRHYQAGTLDGTGAHPNNGAYSWWQLDPTGKQISKMPSFSTMSKEDIAAIVAYLSSL